MIFTNKYISSSNRIIRLHQMNEKVTALCIVDITSEFAALHCKVKIPLWQIDLNPTLDYDMGISEVFFSISLPQYKGAKRRKLWVGITPQQI